MGGSGGGGGSIDPSEISRKVRQAEKQAHDQGFDSKINDEINDLLKDFNGRDYGAIQRHLETINNTLDSEIEGRIDLRYGGSVSKHTYVDGLSDIDALALIHNTDLADKSPEEVKQYFFDQLVQRLPDSKITMGTLAITIKYSDGVEVQILPATKHGDYFRIPNSKGLNEWSHLINPKAFAVSLRAVNQKTAGKLVPMVKLAKSIISSLPENRQLSGYHTEALAVDIFSRYTGVKTVKEMVKYFFDNASDAVHNPLKDKTGQSTHVDDYLGEPNSVERKMVSDSLAQIARKMSNADGRQSNRAWDDILKGE
jgi:hypothetical protein